MLIYVLLLISVATVIIIMRYLQYSKIVNYSNKRYDYKIYRNLSFGIVFFILAFFAVIRDGIGIDYSSYMYHIHNIQLGMPNYMEEGFKLLAKAIGRISPDPRAVIIICAVLTVFFYVRAIYDQSTDVLMSIFIFLSWGYYFFIFNTIRNYLALALCLYSIKFLKDKKYSIFIAFVLLAATFHKSALICIPLYLLANCKYRANQLRLMLLCPIIALILKEQIRMAVFRIYPGYLGSVYDIGRISYLNIIKALLVVILGFIFYKKVESDRLCQIYFHLNIFSFIYYIGCYWMPEISRIGFYMNATTIMFIPNLIGMLELKENRKILKTGIYISGLLLFVLLMRTFYSPNTKLLPYETWLFK